MCRPLTLLAAVNLIVPDHELFELSQHLHRLLSDKEQNKQNRWRKRQSHVHIDYSSSQQEADNKTELNNNIFYLHLRFDG